ncbi:MAG: hypothetical protein CBC36_03415 [Verrucomicrobiaceae bacterium TMED76]|nr:MAG: hypothetical protein CBC36_03415 [Verrucomicrobiaceae bacterium TMED76]
MESVISCSQNFGSLEHLKATFTAARCLDLPIYKEKVDLKLVKQIIQILYIGKNELFKKGVARDK